jgi:gamma-glutamylcyclotransferase (GGCT)/AIG2-like uncharacterized protein YtfP
VGDHAVALLVTDSEGLTDTQAFTITVANVNDPPFFTSAPALTATQDAPYTYAVTADDPDLIHGDALTITAITLPAWLTFEDHGDGAATLSGTPANADVGAHAVALLVTDSGGLTDTQTFTITVANVNDAPAFTSSPVTTATEDALYTYAVTADDPDLIHGDALTITATTLPAWLTFEDRGDGTGTLSGTPASADVGEHAVALRVADSGGLTDMQSFTITVANINDPPEFTSEPVTAATQDAPYTYTVTADDPDLIHGDALTITAPTLPAWLTFEDHGDGAATLSGTPANADVGAHAVALLVTDSGGLTDLGCTVSRQVMKRREYLPCVNRANGRPSRLFLDDKFRSPKGCLPYQTRRSEPGRKRRRWPIRRRGCRSRRHISASGPGLPGRLKPASTWFAAQQWRRPVRLGAAFWRRGAGAGNWLRRPVGYCGLRLRAPACVERDGRRVDFPPGPPPIDGRRCRVGQRRGLFRG